MPSVLLIRKRPSSAVAPSGRPCSRLLTTRCTTSRLSKPLSIICCSAIRHHEVVALRHRLEHVAVQVVVEREHLLVERLPRVVLLEDAVGGHDRIGGARLGQQRRDPGRPRAARPRRPCRRAATRAGSARRRPAGTPPSRPWPARPRGARPPRRSAAARGRGPRRSDCPDRSRMPRRRGHHGLAVQPARQRATAAHGQSRNRQQQRCLSHPIRNARSASPSSSGWCRSWAPWPRPAHPAPREQGQCHGAPSASIGYRASLLSSTFPAIRPRRGPHL